jgi:L-alanine-DL-glutamate epimerase-like enolase superfamily enzyme
MKRRSFFKNTGAAALAASTLPLQSFIFNNEDKHYYYQGRTSGYKDFKLIEEGLKITKIESFTKGQFGVVKVSTDSGATGWGQISTYDADISAMILHRKVARHFLGKDPANIDELSDRCIEANHKFPWSYLSRALSGVDTAIWDLYGKINERPVVELLGGKAGPFFVSGSSMRRDISPEDEAKRLAGLRQSAGYKAFKIRIGSEQGRNLDASPGRTEKLVPLVRKALGQDAGILVDANSCYTPDKAVEVGRMLEQQSVILYEEPCPWWEMEWTREVSNVLNLPVSGGEQDNDMGQWRRMIKARAVDVIQPDPLYLGGIVRTLRAAKMAEEEGLMCVPHSANHGMVSIFALHILGAIPNAYKYMEYSIEFDEGVNKEALSLYEPHLKVVNGAVQVSAEPGWGVQVKTEWLEKADYLKSEI